MNEELFALCSKQANACLRCPLFQGKRVLNRVGSSLTSEALPAALCPSSLPQYTAARLGTIPSAALRSRQGKKKKKEKKNKKKNNTRTSSLRRRRPRPAAGQPNKGRQETRGEVMAHQRRARWEL